MQISITHIASATKVRCHDREVSLLIDPKFRTSNASRSATKIRVMRNPISNPFSQVKLWLGKKFPEAAFVDATRSNDEFLQLIMELPDIPLRKIGCSSL
jgi:hypothetical protein